MNSQQEYSLQDLKQTFKSWWTYFVGKRFVILSVTILFMIGGIFYAFLQKPIYIAEMVFAPENDKGTSMGYAGIAAQFGVDLGSTGAGIFEGDNLMEFFKSKMLIQKTLLSEVNINRKKELLINYYIKVKKLKKSWAEKPELSAITFSTEFKPGIRVRDSIMKSIIAEVGESLEVEKTNQNTNFLVVRKKDPDEIFAKEFIEQLVSNGIQFYVDYRSKKSRENVFILQKQTDSVQRLLTSNVVSVATSNDLNVNPIRQIARARTQLKQVDVQLNSQVYGELLRQLELAKIALRKETPLIQIIDTPVLPLDKKKLGRVKGGLLFGFVGFILISTILMFKKIFS